MPSDPTGSEDDTNSGDLPDPSSGKSYSNVGSLVERVREEASGTDAGDPDSDGEGQGQSPEADSGESERSEGGGSSASETVRMTFHVDRETAERLRNAVYWTATPVTLSGTARDALRAAVEMLEQEHNDGEPFPDRDEELKGGNPNLK